MLTRLARVVQRWWKAAGTGPPVPAVCPFCGQDRMYCSMCGSHRHDREYHIAMQREELRMASAQTGKP